MHTLNYVLIVLLLSKIFLSFEKGNVEMDDSYVAKRVRPLSPLFTASCSQNQT